MRTARLNGALLVLCCVIFLLQTVGYLAPAWFVKVYTVRHGTEGFLADGKRFKLLDSGPLNPDLLTKKPNMTPNLDHGNRNRRNILIDGRESNRNFGGGSGATSDSSNQVMPVLHFGQPGLTSNDATGMPMPDLHSTIQQENNDNRINEIHSISEHDHDAADQGKPVNEAAGSGGSDDANNVDKANTNEDNVAIQTNGNNDRNTNKLPQNDADIDKDDSKGKTDEENSRIKGKGVKSNGVKDSDIDPTPHDTRTDFVDRIDEDSNTGNRQTFGDDFMQHTDHGDGHSLFPPLPTSVWGNDGVDGDHFDNFVDYPPVLDMDGINENSLHDIQDMLGADLTPPPDIKQAMHQARVMENLVTGNRILHITVGLWYGRACVNSHDLLTPSGNGIGTEWCTLYIRRKDSALDNQKNIFEFRIEATLGLGFCLLGLLVAGTTCCCSRRQGTRMIMTLVCLFVSGAVMLVPVIHIIVQHHQQGGVFHRSRDWSRFMVHTYLRNDLFDHWSVILCGCGSLLSVVGSIIFAIIGCRHQKQSNTKYDLSKSESGEIRKELPVNWARNNKITIPSSKMSISTASESLEGYDSDYNTEAKDEDRSSLGYPHGDSLTTDGDEVDTASGYDVKGVIQTGNDPVADKESGVDFLDGVVLDDD